MLITSSLKSPIYEQGLFSIDTHACLVCTTLPKVLQTLNLLISSPKFNRHITMMVQGKKQFIKL